MDLESHARHRSALVTYGSETGTASDYAEEVGRSLERIHFATHVTKLDDVSVLKHYSIVIVVVSTTGQGELPNNARLFWRALLRKKLPITYLEDVQFTTFGLGDSSYLKFNWAARKLHKRLAQLGATEFLPRGEADDQHEEGPDTGFVPWALNLCNELLERYPLPDGVQPISEDVLLQPKWMLSLKEEAANGLVPQLNGKKKELPQLNGAKKENGGSTENGQRAKVETKTIFKSDDDFYGTPGGRILVTLEDNRRMTPSNHWQDVRHLAFTSQASASYAPGDVLTIYPQNSEEDVEQIMQLMEWKDVADKVVEYVSTHLLDEDSGYSSLPAPAPSKSPMTLRQLLVNYLDLTAIPRRSFFSFIAQFTTDQFHKERLLEFTKSEYIEELYDYTTRPRRSILEVLQEFDSVKIPWQWAANVLPELRGRQFSIASGGYLKYTTAGFARFELLVAIVKYKTVIKKIRQGICTRYLAGLQPGARLAVSLHKGGLNITKTEAARPVIMVGPGTGVAPMRALIWERMLWKAGEKELPLDDHKESTTILGTMVLFFGCRNKASDYFYNEEWDRLKDRLPFRVHPAFSRDQSQKVYVQDLIRQEAREVYHLLHDLGGIVYVCGSSGKMPKAIRAAISDVFKQCSNTTEAESENFIEKLEKEGRYKQETW